MKHLTYFLTILLLVVNSISIQAAEIKKWTDESGRVYYGDTPPRSVTSKTIKTNKRPSNIGKPLPRLSTSSSSEKATTQPEGKAPAPSSLEPEQAKDVCVAAKKDLSVIKNSSRIQLRSDDGSLRYMTKDEIKQRQERSQSDVDNYCR